MAEFMNEHIVGERIIRSDGAVEIKDAAAPVSAIVRQDFDELVRRELRSLSQRTVVEAENVSFRAESIVRRSRGESRYMPVDGREIPDSAAGGAMAHTLNRFRFSLNGDVEKRTSVSRFASASNFFASAAV